MAQIGRLANSLFSAINENNASLAHFSVDFSLLKVEVPAEFKPLGLCLSQSRKINAESGSYRRTAWALGALFSEIVPKTPKLRDAFGRRVSEIVKTPGTNPQGSRDDGPFEAYVGVDATSIWASATSGDPAISVLLLACMLARMFAEQRYSTSIWVEIVRTRQKEVLQSAESNGLLYNEAVIAANQPLSRDDLSLFDSSVRAWLSTADSVMSKQRKQLSLILDNLTAIPVSAGTTLYSKVTGAWKSALKGFESLLNGEPQSIIDGSVLLALSAWHIYPNLIVLSNDTKMVDFRDSLVPGSGAITIGFKNSNGSSDDTGFVWSLTLSHLKYYGPPVEVVANDDNTRINIEELEMMVLGALLARWKVPIHDTFTAVLCIYEIGQQLCDASSQYRPASKDFSGTQYDWMKSAFTSARKLRDCTAERRKEFERLIRYGRRRTQALGPSTSEDGAFFGISNVHVFRGLLFSPGNCRLVDVLRSACQARSCPSGLIQRPGEAVIVTKRLFASIQSDLRHPPTDAATIISTLVPHKCEFLKEEVHVHWVIVPSSSPFFVVHERLITESIKEEMRDAGHVLVMFPNQYGPGDVIKEVESEIIWNYPPALLLGSKASVAYYPSDTNEILCPCMKPTQISNSLPPAEMPKAIFPIKPSRKRKREPQSRVESTSAYTCARLVLIPAFGNQSQSCVYSCRPEYENIQLQHLNGHTKHNFRVGMDDLRLPIPESQDESVPRPYVVGLQHSKGVCRNSNFHGISCCNMTPDDLLIHLQRSKFNSVSLKCYFESISDRDFAPADLAMPAQLDLASLNLGQGGISEKLKQCLQMFSIASELYEAFPSATFPVSLLSNLLVIDLKNYFNLGVPRRKNFASKLQFICFFETGGIPVDRSTFQNAFAISSGNSLFVGEAFISDPQSCSSSQRVKRIVGNLGQPGVSVLISPANPMVKKQLDNFRMVEHNPFNFARKDSFSGTSLHLSLTDWKIPIYGGEVGLIDTQIVLTEAVVSVRHRGEWIADIDVLQTVPKLLVHFDFVCGCNEQQKLMLPDEATDLVSIDRFEEILDPPEGIGVFRAQGNWPARLAAACLLSQKFGSSRIPLLPSSISCWNCVIREMRRSYHKRNLGPGTTMIFVD